MEITYNDLMEDFDIIQSPERYEKLLPIDMRIFCSSYINRDYFLYLLTTHDDVQYAISMCDKSLEYKEEIKNRIQRCLNYEAEKSYANPVDIYLYVYLFILKDKEINQHIKNLNRDLYYTMDMIEYLEKGVN
jgi:hypothetical protein